MAKASTAGQRRQKNQKEETDAVWENKSDGVNDYSGIPPELSIAKERLGQTLGSSTGEEEHAVEAGGWEGTDDATSTAPSDLQFDVPESKRNHIPGEISTDEDPTGRAYGGGLDPEHGGIAELTGKPVGESRDWDVNPVDFDESGS